MEEDVIPYRTATLWAEQARGDLAGKLMESVRRARLEIDGFTPETHEGLALLQILTSLMSSIERAA